MTSHHLHHVPAGDSSIAEAIVIVPLGATEQHGPHLPLGTDSIIVDRVAHSAAKIIGPTIKALVAPVIPIGYSENHLRFGTTASARIDTYISLLRDTCMSLLATGVRHLFLLNGHGGNVDAMNVVARDVGIASGKTIGAGSYWTLAEANLAGLQGRPVRIPGHAGDFETSMMLHLCSKLVRDHRVKSLPAPSPADPPHLRIESPTRRIGATGVTDDAANASAPNGSKYFTAIVDGVGASLMRYYGAATEQLPSHPLQAE